MESVQIYLATKLGTRQTASPAAARVDGMKFAYFITVKSCSPLFTLQRLPASMAGFFLPADKRVRPMSKRVNIHHCENKELATHYLPRSFPHRLGPEASVLTFAQEWSSQ